MSSPAAMPVTSRRQAAAPFLLSIDYEDVRQELVGGFDNPDRLPLLTERWLTFLRAHRVSATFFVSGDTAERHASLIGDIVAAGHEIGCHGWRHIPLARYRSEEFADDLRRSLDALNAAGAKEVIGYRAPYLSLTEASAWAYERLAELGFVYSSSVLPARNFLYGWPSFGTNPRRVAGVLELPVSVAWLGVLSPPFASGAYFRAVPWPVLRALFRRFRAARRPVLGYFHPQDVDIAARVRYQQYGVVGNACQYYNRGKVLPRLAALLAEEHWFVMPYASFVERHSWPDRS
jgi:polysaccharide deacetylase family protein (PEP-CTERM system associated)